MNVGIVTTWFERGAAYVSQQFRDVLENAEYEVYIFARGGERNGKGEEKWDDPKVHWAKKSLFRDSSGIDIKDFKKWIKYNKIEIVLFNEQRSWEPVLLCKKWKIKTAAYIDYYTENQINLFSIYDALICNTRRHYSVFKWHPGVEYVPWGTDINLFKPKPSETDLIEWPIFFHSAGYAATRKGTDLLIEAFSKLQKKAKLIIHCQSNLSENFPHLKTTIQSLVNKGVLEIIEKTVSAPGLYHLGDVYVYPARLDGIGLTVCEALSCGLPVIVPNNPPMNEFAESDDYSRKVKIKNYISRYDGYYWPQGIVSVKDLMKKMDYFIDNFNNIEQYKNSARNYVLKSRNWSENSKKVPSIFESISFNPLPYKLNKYPKDAMLEQVYKNFMNSFSNLLKGYGKS